MISVAQKKQERAYKYTSRDISETGNDRDGYKLYVKELIKPYGLNPRVVNYISKCLVNNPQAISYVEKVIEEYISLAIKAKFDKKQIETLLAEYFEKGICPPVEEVRFLIKEYKKRGYSPKKILSLPEIFRDDTPEDIKNLLSILLRKSGRKVNVENLAQYTRFGLTNNREQFIRKVGICLSIGNTAEDILANYRVLTDTVPLDMFYGIVMDELAISGRNNEGRKLPRCDEKMDLDKILKRVYEEKNKISEEEGKKGKQEADVLYVPITDRYILVKFTNDISESRANNYMGLSASKK